MVNFRGPTSVPCDRARSPYIDRNLSQPLSAAEQRRLYITQANLVSDFLFLLQRQTVDNFPQNERGCAAARAEDADVDDEAQLREEDQQVQSSDEKLPEPQKEQTPPGEGEDASSADVISSELPEQSSGSGTFRASSCVSDPAPPRPSSAAASTTGAASRTGAAPSTGSTSSMTSTLTPDEDAAELPTPTASTSSSSRSSTSGGRTTATATAWPAACALRPSRLLLALVLNVVWFYVVYHRAHAWLEKAETQGSSSTIYPQWLSPITATLVYFAVLYFGIRSMLMRSKHEPGDVALDGSSADYVFEFLFLYYVALTVGHCWMFANVLAECGRLVEAVTAGRGSHDGRGTDFAGHAEMDEMLSRGTTASPGALAEVASGFMFLPMPAFNFNINFLHYANALHAMFAARGWPAAAAPPASPAPHFSDGSTLSFENCAPPGVTSFTTAISSYVDGGPAFASNRLSMLLWVNYMLAVTALFDVIPLVLRNKTHQGLWATPVYARIFLLWTWFLAARYCAYGDIGVIVLVYSGGQGVTNFLYAGVMVTRAVFGYRARGKVNMKTKVVVDHTILSTARGNDAAGGHHDEDREGQHQQDVQLDITHSTAVTREQRRMIAYDAALHIAQFVLLSVHAIYAAFFGSGMPLLCAFWEMQIACLGFMWFLDFHQGDHEGSLLLGTCTSRETGSTLSWRPLYGGVSEHKFGGRLKWAQDEDAERVEQTEIVGRRPSALMATRATQVEAQERVSGGRGRVEPRRDREAKELLFPGHERLVENANGTATAATFSRAHERAGDKEMREANGEEPAALRTAPRARSYDTQKIRESEPDVERGGKDFVQEMALRSEDFCASSDEDPPGQDAAQRIPRTTSASRRSLSDTEITGAVKIMRVDKTSSSTRLTKHSLSPRPVDALSGGVVLPLESPRTTSTGTIGTSARGRGGNANQTSEASKESLPLLLQGGPGKSECAGTSHLIKKFAEAVHKVEGEEQEEGRAPPPSASSTTASQAEDDDTSVTAPRHPFKRRASAPAEQHGGRPQELLPSNQKSEKENRRPKLMFSFDSSGWLYLYHLGVAHAIQSHFGKVTQEDIDLYNAEGEDVVEDSDSKTAGIRPNPACLGFSGSSGGALTGVILATGMDAGKVAEYSLREFPKFHDNPREAIASVDASLTKFLEPNMWKRAKNRVRILLTNVSAMFNFPFVLSAEVASDFQSESHLKACLRATSFVPFIAGWIPFKMTAEMVRGNGGDGDHAHAGPGEGPAQQNENYKASDGIKNGVERSRAGGKCRSDNYVTKNNESASCGATATASAPPSSSTPTPPPPGAGPAPASAAPAASRTSPVKSIYYWDGLVWFSFLVPWRSFSPTEDAVIKVSALGDPTADILPRIQIPWKWTLWPPSQLILKGIFWSGYQDAMRYIRDAQYGYAKGVVSGKRLSSASLVSYHQDPTSTPCRGAFTQSASTRSSHLLTAGCGKTANSTGVLDVGENIAFACSSSKESIGSSTSKEIVNTRMGSGASGRSLSSLSDARDNGSQELPAPPFFTNKLTVSTCGSEIARCSHVESGSAAVSSKGPRRNLILRESSTLFRSNRNSMVSVRQNNNYVSLLQAQHDMNSRLSSAASRSSLREPITQTSAAGRHQPARCAAATSSMSVRSLEDKDNVMNNNFTHPAAALPAAPAGYPRKTARQVLREILPPAWNYENRGSFIEETDPELWEEVLACIAHYEQEALSAWANFFVNLLVFCAIVLLLVMEFQLLET